MPVVIGKPEESNGDPQDVQSLLFKDDGETLTLEGEIIRDFLDGVDFGPVFDDPEVRESGIIKAGEAFCIEKDGELEPADEGDEGAQVYPIETIDSEALAQVVDADDLLAMFEWHVENEMPSETLEGKARLAAARQLLGYPVDEAKGPFKKGEFKRIRKKPKGVDRVMRMLLAMIHKESIRRVAKGTGYKKGDYKKHPAGYAGGTPSGLKKWKKYRTKFAAKIKKAAVKAKMVKGGAKKKATPKVGAAKKLAKKGAQKGKRTVAAAEKPAPKGKRLLEGAGLAGAIVGKITDGRAPQASDAKQTG